MRKFFCTEADGMVEIGRHSYVCDNAHHCNNFSCEHHSGGFVAEVCEDDYDAMNDGCEEDVDVPW